MSELMSAKPNSYAPPVTRGMASRDPLPVSIVTSSPSASKYPLSKATKYGAAGPSNFQSSENLMGVKAKVDFTHIIVANRIVRNRMEHSLVY